MSNSSRSRYASVFRPGLFAGQLHWVTGGGSSSIGRCAANELASLGATVLISGRTQAKLEGGEHAGVRVNAFAPGWIASSGLDT